MFPSLPLALVRLITIESISNIYDRIRSPYTEEKRFFANANDETLVSGSARCLMHAMICSLLLAHIAASSESDNRCV